VVPGSATVTEAPPPAGTAVGVAVPSTVPLRAVPVGLSRRNSIDSPSTKFAMDPVRVAGVRVSVGDSVSDGAPTVTDVLAL
jgi:hypothetical protein